MMAYKKILSEGIVDWGKHKGKTGLQIAQCDPGYLYWCVANGVADVETVGEMSSLVVEWAGKNKREADKILSRATR